MDIHPPHAAVRTTKDFLLHLSIVTLGIIIALSLEGLLEWRHHRELVHEARANIVREIQDNKSELDNALSKAPEVEKSQKIALQLVEDTIAHRKTNVHNLSLAYGIVQLHNSSWETAQSTGAISYMNYDEVRRYAEIYDLQRQLDHLQDQLLENYIVSLPSTDPARASEAELDDTRRGILRTLSYLHAGEQIAQALSNQYSQALSSK
jgi:hypothetical protein